MRVLHVSDLHASEKHAAGQREITDALLRDVEAQHAVRPFEVIVMSGDLAFSGCAEEFELGKSMLLDPLLNCTQLGVERLVLVPGNHDVQRARIDAIYEAGMQASLTDLDAVDTFLQSGRLRPEEERLAGWQDFVAKTFAGVSQQPLGGLGVGRRLMIEGADVRIAALNSAWRAAGGEEDRGRLLVSRAQMSEAISFLSGSDIRLVVLHHPLPWLARFDQDYVRPELERVPTIVLTGHEHSAEPTSEITPRGSAIYGRAGCLYESRVHPNSYAIIDVAPDEGNVAFELRTWQKGRHEFDLGVDIARGGRMKLPLVQPQAELAKAQPPFSAVQHRLAEIVLEGSVLPEPRADEAGSPDDVLVQPRFWPLPYREMRSAALNDDGVPRRADPLAALAEGRVVVVAGDAQSGVTSALVWLIARHFESDSSRAPAYVRLHAANFKAIRFRKELRRALERVGYSDIDAGNLPPMVVAVDDVLTQNPGVLRALAKFISGETQHRFVIGTRGAGDELIAALEDRDLQVARAYLGPLGRRELRQLVRKTVGADAPELTSRVLGATGSQMPRNPFVISALAAVLATKTDIKNLNQSGLFEAYVGLLLGHDSLVSVAEDPAMDYRKREHILSAFAGHLVENNVTMLPKIDVEEFVAGYIRARGLSLSPGDVVRSLIRRRVLVEDIDGGVGFRQLGLRAFFAGKWMAEDPEFGKRAVENPLRFAGAIRHAAGLRRGDKDLLRVVGKETDSAFVGLPEHVAVDLFDSVGDRPGWVQDAPNAEALAARLSNRENELSEEEVEDELDKVDEQFEMMPRTTSASTFEFSPTLPPSVALLSSVLRSSELVDDVELKGSMLKAAIHGWSLMTIVVAIDEDVTSRFRERLKASAESDEEADSIERAVESLLTTTFVFLVEAALGGVHLQSVTRRVLDDAKFMESSAHAMFTTFLYMFLDGEGWPSHVEQLYGRFHGHPIISRLALNFSVARYTEDRNLKTGDLQELERFLGEVYSSSGKLPGKAKSVVKGQTKGEVIQRLRTARQKALRPTAEFDFDAYLDGEDDEAIDGTSQDELRDSEAGTQ